MNGTPRTKLRKGLTVGVGLAVAVPLLAVAAGAVMANAGYTLNANLTPSVPVGLYVANANFEAIERGQLVAFQAHNDASRMAYREGWVKPGASFNKRVGAVAGDMVCVKTELAIIVSEKGQPAHYNRIGPVADTDKKGTPLPHALKGCNRVPEGHFLPVGDGLPNSFDGRYYGFVPLAQIDAVLTPIWTQTTDTE